MKLIVSKLWLAVFLPSFMQAAFTVQKIETIGVAQEYPIFEKYATSFFDLDANQAADKMLIEQTFAYDQQTSLDYGSDSLTVRVLFCDHVVAYASCDMVTQHQMRIRNLVFDPELYDAALIKEILFSLFESFPKTKHVVVGCPMKCSQLADILSELGFKKVENVSKTASFMYHFYELHIHPKCKICEVLYGGMWDNEEDSDSNWADSVPQDGVYELIEQSPREVELDLSSEL